MKNRKTIFTIIFALVLALSIATVSAAAISVNEAWQAGNEARCFRL